MQLLSRFSRLTSVVILALLICSFSVASPATVSDQFGHSWTKLIQQLKRLGISKIGDFDVATFANDASTIKWTAIKKLPPSVVSGPRESAYFVRKERAVYILQNLSAEALKALPNLELHEALGVLNYNDQNYQLSSAIALLVRTKTPEQRRELLAKFAQSVFKREEIFAQIGGSSVGSGGDVNAVMVKNLVLDEILKASPNASLDFLATYPTIDFEPIYRADVTQVSIDYKLRKAGGIHIVGDPLGPVAGVAVHDGYQELISILFPVSKWQHGGAGRAKMISDIKEKVMNLFPVAGGQPLHGAPSGDCPSGPSLQFPDTADQAVREIQALRASLLQGCHAERSETEIVAPPLPPKMSLAVGGFFSFDCAFQFNGNRIKSSLRAAQGLRSDITATTSVVNDDYVAGSIQVDNNGDLVSTMLIYHPPGGGKPTFEMARAQDRRHTQIELSIQGKPMIFECVGQE